MISFFDCSFVFMVKMFTSTEDVSFCQKRIRMHSACKSMALVRSSVPVPREIFISYLKEAA